MSFLTYQDAATVPSELLFEYAASDADATWRSYEVLLKQLRREGLWDYFITPMMELSKNLTVSSLLGIKVDKQRVKALSDTLTDTLEDLETRIFEAAGKEINVRSSAQKAWLLFDRLGLPTRNVPRSPKTEAVSLTKQVLAALHEEYRHPVIHYLLEHSAISKLQTTYVHPGITKHMDSEARVHPFFNVAGAVTGRVLSREPPVATIPRDKEYNFLGTTRMLSLRDMFVAEPRCELTYADVSQAELAVALIVSGEEAGLEILRRGGDFHNEVAWSCLGVPVGEKPSKEKRTLSKNIVFGKLLYGGSSEGVAAQAGVDVALVEEAYLQFAQKFPRLVRFQEAIGSLALQEGYLVTPFGRKRRFRGYTNDDPKIRGEIRRQGQNLFCQNGAAEVVFRAFNRICTRFRKHKMKAWPRNIVYDSIITEHPRSESQAVREIMTEEMTRPVPELENYRFAIDIGQADNWGDAERGAQKFYPFGS